MNVQQSLKYNPLKDWDYLVMNWSVEPVLLTTTQTAQIFSYTLEGVTRYRSVPLTYLPTQDAFYANFDGVTLTNLITSRG